MELGPITLSDPGIVITPKCAKISAVRNTASGVSKRCAAEAGLSTSCIPILTKEITERD